MRYPANKIKDAVIAVTYKCNSGCITCNICRNTPPEELDLRYYERLPSELRNVGISGGEPTLRDDIVEVIGVIRKRCSKAKLTFSTNGLDVARIERQMSDIYNIDKNVGIAVSIDGLYEINDNVRGVPDSFNRAVSTIKLLKGIGFKDLRISFNICDENVRDMDNVYRLSKELKTAFTCSLVQNSASYFQKTDNLFTMRDALKEKLNGVIKSELNSAAPKKWFMSYYDYGLYYMHSRGRRLLGCGALRDFFFVDPRGEIYPCVFKDEVIGNLKEHDNFFEIWHSRKAIEARKRTESCPTACWQLCTVRTSILNNIVPVGSWVLRKKLAALAGRDAV